MTSISQSAQTPLLGTPIPSWVPQPQLRAVTAPMVQTVSPHVLLPLSFKKFGGSQIFCDVGS